MRINGVREGRGEGGKVQDKSEDSGGIKWKIFESKQQ